MTETIAPSDPTTDLRLEREFPASADRLYRAWTDPKALARWCFPRDFTVPYSKADFRPGGTYRTCLTAPDGVEHWVRGTYLELTPPRRIVFTHAWEDADGDPGRVTTITITLTELGPRRTLLVLEQTGLASVASRDGHGEGWSETLDNLAAFLETEE